MTSRSKKSGKEYSARLEKACAIIRTKHLNKKGSLKISQIQSIIKDCYYYAGKYDLSGKLLTKIILRGVPIPYNMREGFEVHF